MPKSSKAALWGKIATGGLPTGLALWLYWIFAAPGLTWAHAGADGGDLLAAAVVNGVPHPSGYPLYTLLLRAWLWLGHLLNPQLETAFWGNRLSGLCVAAAVGFTAATCAALLRDQPKPRLWAPLAALAFAITPLAWSQALITEVYGLHALLIAALGWVALTQRGSTRRASHLLLGLLMGLGVAHHLTTLLLWPALLYWWLGALPPRRWLAVLAQIGGIALLVALLFYGGLVWRVAMAAQPLPVAWGYPRNLSGLWWLVSGAAYRGYVFGMSPLEYVGRLAALARLLVEQYSPLGLAVIIGGFAVWDRQRPLLRNGAILWALPISLYAAGYNTVDSYIYLLPVAWLMSLLLAQGLTSASSWLAQQLQRLATASPVLVALVAPLIAAIATTMLLILFWGRLPDNDLRSDHAAQDFLSEAATTLQPRSLVVSSADASTFALWYGAWGSSVSGSGTLAQTLPDTIFVNYALYEFGWYRELMHDLYPQVPKMGASFAEMIAANQPQRPIYFTEPVPEFQPPQLTATGSFWQLKQP